MKRKMTICLLAFLLLSGCGSAEAPAAPSGESEPTTAIQQAEQPKPILNEDAAEPQKTEEEKPDQAEDVAREQTDPPAPEAPAAGQPDPGPAPPTEPEPQSAPETTPEQAETAPPINAGTVFEGYEVKVNDWDTPAVFAAGKDWPITTWYFYDTDGQVLGSIPNSAVMGIARTDGTDNVDWEIWLADAFNDYRDAGGSEATAQEPTPEPPKATQEKPEDENPAPLAPSPTEQPEDADPEELALEVIRLTNAEREKHGLHPLEVDDGLMELAMIRAEEISRKYSHERPDGTRISQEYGYGENCGAKASPEKQVDSWMNSEGHRTNILIDWYNSIGMGCYQNGTGKTYWVQVFSR